ncbi:MAG: hypothetical protein IH804_00910 [Planctomycetes bacterium]|nr:hypothetical protein [Planctomycetota bacterium]
MGSRIAKHLAQHGAVRRLTRHSEPRFALGEPVPKDALAGVDVLVHCAYDFRPRSSRDIKRTNVAGTLTLFDAVRDHGCRTSCSGAAGAGDAGRRRDPHPGAATRRLRVPDPPGCAGGCSRQNARPTRPGSRLSRYPPRTESGDRRGSDPRAKAGRKKEMAMRTDEWEAMIASDVHSHR